MNKISTPIILYCNNYVGWKALDWFIANHFNVVGVVVHKAESAYFHKQIVELSKKFSLPVLEYSPKDKSQLDAFAKQCKAQVGISCYFGYIFTKEHIALMSGGILNLHGAYLPWCKGKNPNAWTIVDKVKAGVTLHLVSEVVDAGPIIAQIEVPVLPDSTAKTLYHAMEQASLQLIREEVPNYLSGKSTLLPQEQLENGSYHTADELPRLKQLDLGEVKTVGEVIDTLRACTFPPFLGAYFYQDGVKYEVKIEINRVLE